jgi:hypothetical protein
MKKPPRVLGLVRKPQFSRAPVGKTMADSLGYEDDFEEQSEHPSELSVDFFEETIESARIPLCSPHGLPP